MPPKTRGEQPQVASSGKVPRGSADRSVLQSVQRAARVLDEVCHRGTVTINDLATALDLDRTIVYRLVRTLESEGLLESASNGYRMGRRALMLGNAYIESLPVVRASLP